MLRATFIPHAAIFALVVLFPHVVFAGTKPSFDCAKAGSTAEKAICKNNELAASDAAIAIAYKKLQTTLDPKAAAALAEDERWFIGTRDAIAEAAEGMARSDLGSALKDRLKFLKAINPHPSVDFAGSWHNIAGGFDITSAPDGTLTVNGNAAHPVTGNWVCEFNGSAKPDGATLVVKDENDKGNDNAAALRLTRDGAALKVETIPATTAADGASPYCGVNGSFDGPYFSVPSGYY
ncbi:lysozyme inhibitor LprI family protein [Rhizobium sp.]|uniref:lysozyme inhibitor LprI family protein n=1 Tax=Rhizobium sp. TaxID=391 RepID=UPI0034C5C8B8